MTIAVDRWASTAVAQVHETDVWKEAVTLRQAEYAGSGAVIDIDGRCVIGQFILWPSGSIEASALAIADERQFYTDSGKDLEPAAVDERWNRFLAAVTEVEIRR